MGNRAILRIDDLDIYLHWNGGRASVEGFLQAARELGCAGNDDYTAARLIQVIGNFFGGTNSLGVATEGRTAEAYDNGVYILNDGLQIVDREDGPKREQVDAALTQGIYEVCMRVNGPIFSKGN